MPRCWLMCRNDRWRYPVWMPFHFLIMFSLARVASWKMAVAITLWPAPLKVAFSWMASLRCEKKFWFVQPDGDLDTASGASSQCRCFNFYPQSRVLQLQGPRSLEIIHAATKGCEPAHGVFQVGSMRRTACFYIPNRLDRRAGLWDLYPWPGNRLQALMASPDRKWYA